MLEVREAYAGYGGVKVLRNLSMRVADQEVVALLGANGSGKTTFINGLSGFIRMSGVAELDGKSILGDPPHAVFCRGIVQVSQSRDLFTQLTVEDNVTLGAVRSRRRVGAKAVSRRLAWIHELFPRLAERRGQRVGTLSGGEQQMVAIARALMGFPRILMLDEPSGGLAPLFVSEIGRVLKALKSEGATVLLVEQNLGLAAMASDRFYILRAGEVVHEGSGDRLDVEREELGNRFYL